MNTQMLSPGYIVNAKNPLTTNRYTPRTFRDAHLLTARQAAFQYAQQLVAQKQVYDVLDITIDLVEIDRTEMPNPIKVIATAFSQRFHRADYKPEGEAQTISMNVDALTAKSLPSSFFLTMDLTKEDQIFSSKSAVWTGLEELENEAGYYQNNGYQTGFGYVQLEEVVERNLLAKGILKPAANTYVVLYDAFAYGASIISRFNENCTDDDEVLGFRTQFLSPEYNLEGTH